MNAQRGISHILQHGCLASRILAHTGKEPSRKKIIDVYTELAACLQDDRPFV